MYSFNEPLVAPNSIAVNKNECDYDVFQNGDCFAVIVGLEPNENDILATILSNSTGTKVDWHYFAGRASFRVLGSVNAVQHQLMTMVHQTDFGKIQILLQDVVDEE